MKTDEVFGQDRDRVRFEDFWGGSSVNYEPEVALMLNPSRENRQIDVRDVVFSIEKNRLGPTGVSFTQSLLGPYFAFRGTSGDLLMKQAP